MGDDLEDEAVFTIEEQAHHKTRQLVIKALIGYSLVALIAVTFLSVIGTEVPESLIATLSMAVGALGGLAAK